MNDLTPQERDELASAYLDGEVTAQERAMVEADPDLLARVEQLRHAAQEVASPATEAGREEIIAEAMKAFKPEPAKQPEKLASRQLRSRQREARAGFLLELREQLRNRRLAPILGAAAALAVVFLAITFFALTNEDTGEDSDAASYATDAPATTSEFAQILESAELQTDDALADSAAAFAPATAAASATTAAPATTIAMAASPDPAPSGEGAIDAMTQADLSTGAEASSLEAEEQPEADGPPPQADGPPPEAAGPPPQADGPPSEARAQLAEPDGGLDAECPEDEPAEEESPEESPEDAAEEGSSVSEPDDAQNSLDPDTSPETSLNPSSTTSSLPPDEASEEDLSDLNTDIFEDASLAECP